jgi:hypothetical protein
MTTSVPYNGNNFQYARTGTSMAGIWAYQSGNYREYLQVELNDTLLNSKCYLVSYYVNLHNKSWLAIKNIDAYLSPLPPNVPSPNKVLPYPAQIISQSSLTDTLGWTVVRGIYVATGNETHLTIGNFNDDTQMIFDTVSAIIGYDPYYFVDDVSVIPIDSIGIPAFAGNDTLIYQGDSAFIGQAIYNLNCNWYVLGGSQIASNISGLYVQPNVNTTYVVEQNLCGTITYDTVTVNVSPVGIFENINLIHQINISPNPSTTSEFLLNGLPDQQKVEMRITDLNGNIVDIQKVNPVNGQAIVRLTLPNGMYLANFIIGEKKEVHKLIILKQ